MPIKTDSNVRHIAADNFTELYKQTRRSLSVPLYKCNHIPMYRSSNEGQGQGV